MTDANKKLRRRQWSVFGVGIILVVLAVFWTYAPPDPTLADDAAPAPLPPVSVIKSAPATYAAQIRVQAIAHPRNDLTVRAMISAPVAEISGALLPGELVTKGHLIIRLETHTLEAQLADAHNRLATARLSLATEEAEAERARDEWARSGEVGDPPPLRTRAPQLEAAHAELRAATAQIEDVEQAMRYANIIAPFDAIVVERSVSPGEMVSAGEPLARLQQSSVLDLAVQLSERERALLGSDLSTNKAGLIDRASGARYDAEIRVLGGVVDPATRLETIYLVHERDAERSAGLSAGSVVDVVFQGRPVDGLYRVPESAFTRDGFVWAVDRENRLRRVAAELVFAREGDAHLRLADQDSQTLRIAVSPVSSFVHGVRVDPRPETSEQAVR